MLMEQDNEQKPLYTIAGLAITCIVSQNNHAAKNVSMIQMSKIVQA